MGNEYLMVMKLQFGKTKKTLMEMDIGDGCSLV